MSLSFLVCTVRLGCAVTQGGAQLALCGHFCLNSHVLP